MNTSLFFRLANRASKIHASRKYSNVSRAFQHFSCSSMSTNVSVSAKSEKESFQDVLPCIIDSIRNNQRLKELPEVTNWIKKILEYNLAGGKKTRGLATVFAYEMLEKPENLSEETIKLARIMGWCVEMLQAYFLVSDDMMDGSTTRRGVTCWYQLPEVKLGAINDCILIYTSMFQLLRTYFGNTPQYVDIVDLFNETILLTSSGQQMDFATSHRKKDDYSLFTVERYHTIVKHKTAFYTCNLPMGLGMLLANITDKETFRRTEDICLDIGILFQVQDDFIDCYVDESVSGKAGTDIQEGKCSWLAVTALQRCNSAQRRVFTENYGSSDKASCERIKRLYDELELSRIYRELERSSYDAIVTKANLLSQDTALSPKVFLKLIDMIYKRKL